MSFNEIKNIVESFIDCSPGIDEIPMKVIKHSLDAIISLQNGNVSFQLKVLRITPESSGPIAILPSIGKINDYYEVNGLLSDC